MGTRHLVAVVSGGVFKVAQYGQWDGYPEGQGATVLGFLAGLGGNLAPFRAAVENCEFLDDGAIEALTEPHGENWPEVFPQLSRDMGGKILAYVLKNGGGKLCDRSDFGRYSLFCEYAYVIDLDEETLEFYEGFQRAPHTSGRWADAPADGGYYGVRLLKTYPLSNLPTVADLNALLKSDEEE